MLRGRVLVVGLASVFAGSASGQVTVFQGDHAGWAAAAGALRTLITFDDFALSAGESASIAPNHYPGLTLGGIPSTPGTGAPFALNPGSADRTSGVDPVSESNVLQLSAPTIRNGILEITFSTPIIAFGGYFIDTETSAIKASTGIWTNADSTRYTYGGSLGNGVQHFIGVVSTTPFTKAQIHLGSEVNPSTDGLAFDNLEYAVPTPGAAGVLGLAALFGGRRRR